LKTAGKCIFFKFCIGGYEPFLEVVLHRNEFLEVPEAI